MIQEQKILIDCFFYFFYIDISELKNFIIFDKNSNSYKRLGLDNFL